MTNSLSAALVSVVVVLLARVAQMRLNEIALLEGKHKRKPNKRSAPSQSHHCWIFTLYHRLTIPNYHYKSAMSQLHWWTSSVSDKQLHKQQHCDKLAVQAKQNFLCSMLHLSGQLQCDKARGFIVAIETLQIGALNKMLQRHWCASSRIE